MRSVLRIALLTVAFGLGTYAFGWWTVPLIAAAWGLMTPVAPRAAGRAAVAALLAWAVLLVLPQLAGAPILALGDELAGVMRLPAWALWVTECAFPALLAWSAAALTGAIRGRPRSAT